MRALRKVMMGASVGALALAVVGGVNAEAAAAKNDGGINAKNQTMEVSNTDTKKSTESFVSFDAAKYDKKAKADVWNAKAKWDVYDLAAKGSAIVDLSALNTAKDNYIAVQDYANTDAVNVLKIPADTDKFSGAYAAGKVTFKKGKEAVDLSKEGAPTFEYRTLNASTWTVYDPADTDLSNYAQQGATLYFRKAAADFEFGDAVADAEENANMTVATAEAGNFAGKEFKVKVAKMGNGPSVAIDYVNAKLKTNDKLEYRTEIAGEEWTATTKDGIVLELTETSGKNEVAKNGVVEVRTKATDKKAASKITVIKYTGILAPEVTDNSKDDAPNTVAGLTVKVNKNAAGKTGKGSVEFTNDKDSGVTYLIYVDGTAKPVATVKPTGKAVKVAETKFTTGKAVKIATAADAKKGIFQSPTADLQDAETGYDFAPAAAEEE